MHIKKGSFRLDNNAGAEDEVTGWLPFSPFNLWLVPIAAVAIFFVYNLWLFGLASIALAFIFYKKLKEEYKKTDSKAMRITITLLSIVIFAFCIVVLYKIGVFFRETGIH
jgi:amino acid transporter